MENWRSTPVHSFGYEVQCGGCLAWVTQVAARDVADAKAGKGRCSDCVAKSPVVVEVPTSPGPEMPLDAEEPVSDVAGAVEVPGTIEEVTETSGPSLGEPAEPENEEAPPKKRR